MTYLDGFLLPVPADKMDEYKKIASIAFEVWKEHGALDYRECQLDEDNIAHLRSMANTADAKEGETVMFAYILYKSREDRDAINMKVMEDPRMAQFSSADMPFDDSRMAMGGFHTIIE